MRKERVVVAIDEDGQPIYGTRRVEVSERQGMDRVTGNVQDRDTLDTGTEPSTRPDRGLETARFRREGEAHPLDPVLAVVGTRAEFASVSGLRARVTSSVVDADGQEVHRVDRRWHGEAGVSGRDRFESPDGTVVVLDPSEQRPTRGRGSGERDIGRLFSVLLRMPWSLADEERFEVEAGSPGRVPGTVEFRATAKASSESPRVDLQRRRSRDVYVLICDAATLEPLGMRLKLEGSGDGRSRRIYFAASRRVGAVEMVSRLEFLHGDGRLASRLEVSDLAAGAIDEALFASPDQGVESSTESPNRDASAVFPEAGLNQRSPTDDG